ncbi:MAG: GAF domain-containing sensor histidine kinase [Chloroflexota bacterium]
MVSQPPGSSDSNRCLSIADGNVGDKIRYDDQRLSTVLEIARILASSQDPHTLVPNLLRGLIETFDKADAGMLFLVDADRHLVVKSAHGYDSAPLRQVRLAPGESIAGKVFLNSQATLYPTPDALSEGMSNTTAANRESFRRAAAGLRQPQSVIGLPLTSDETPLGVLVLEHIGQTESFSPSDLPFCQHIADLISASIEQALHREEHQAAQAIEEANRLKAELVSILAHEMRTPLTSIKGYSTALLMEEAVFSAETQREFLEIIDEECDVLQDLIHDLLESSIIDAGLLRLDPQPVRLPSLVRSMIEDTSHRAQGIRFLIDFPESFPILDADPDRIVQVFRNLLDNALKYSPQGGLVVVRGELRESEVVISVADQGIGIAPEHLNRLFEKFFRVKSGLGRHVVGSGLGLPIARNIVESHGGLIWAESQVGRGSTFYFTLPLRNRKQEMIEDEREQDD